MAEKLFVDLNFKFNGVLNHWAAPSQEALESGLGAVYPMFSLHSSSLASKTLHALCSWLGPCLSAPLSSFPACFCSALTEHSRESRCLCLSSGFTCHIYSLAVEGTGLRSGPLGFSAVDLFRRMEKMGRRLLGALIWPCVVSWETMPGTNTDETQDLN